MPVRLSTVERAQARGRAVVGSLCRELEEARIASGLSYAAIGAAVGISGQQAARICRGESRTVSFVRLAGLLPAVGLDLSSRAYPAGLPVRDAAHLGLLSRFRSRLPDSIRWRAEAPVVEWESSLPGRPASGYDRRAWDARIEGPGWRVGVEAETRLGDVQALERRIALKQRDGNVGAVLLLVNDTAHNRRTLADEGLALRDHFPGSARRALRLLAGGRSPGANAILIL